jgi:hypothetical protein
MARGSHGLPKVSLWSAMLNPSTPCRQPWAIPKTAIQPFQGWPPIRRAACGCPLPPWIPQVVRLWNEEQRLGEGTIYEPQGEVDIGNKLHGRRWLPGPQEGTVCGKSETLKLPFILYPILSHSSPVWHGVFMDSLKYR